MRIMSRGGKRYVCVIVDDYCRFTWALFLASKDETFGKFITFIKKVEKRVGHSLVCLRSDHGIEFENSSLVSFVMNMVLNITFQLQEYPAERGGRAQK